MTTMQINSHSFDRMNIRLSGREKAQVINAIMTKWNRLENNSMRDFAIVAMTLDGIRKTDESSWESNGDAVVGIVRKGSLMTVMLRRFNQPMTQEALRVDAVKWAIKPPQQAKKMARKLKKRNYR
jgi:hypothetical protein